MIMRHQYCLLRLQPDDSCYFLNVDEMAEHDAEVLVEIDVFCEKMMCKLRETLVILLLVIYFLLLDWLDESLRYIHCWS